MLLQAALNGPFTKDEHPAMPITVAELAADARACVEAGAGAIHMHPRNQWGEETLDPDVINAAVREVKAACGVPVGVSTGAWIEPDHAAKLRFIAAWTEPDYASVNVSEDGWLDVVRALRENGIGVEAGVWSIEDARALAAALAGDDSRASSSNRSRPIPPERSRWSPRSARKWPARQARARRRRRDGC